MDMLGLWKLFLLHFWHILNSMKHKIIKMHKCHLSSFSHVHCATAVNWPQLSRPSRVETCEVSVGHRQRWQMGYMER